MFDLDPWLARQASKEIRLPLPDAEFTLIPEFLTADLAVKAFVELNRQTPWRSDKVKVFGKWYDQPRLTAWYATNSFKYSYSGLELQSIPITPGLQTLMQTVQQRSGKAFNSVLLNLYRDGQDSNGWHSDNEKELGPDPFIASLSLGETRVFHLKHRSKKESYKLSLGSGSLLLMGKNSQTNWKHQLPKTKKKTESRINCTFRYIFPQD